ncbi:GMP synthase-Glutamine amidotransferase [Auraticoccus monumenti]|uniref:GMP synthase-Glutamine amidotransferase n=1 Tax=Auraticoccus monumenti TaxID=675864 RepID=A0A1G6V5D5_9ACTN|nr:GMP synthase-Glutamine amidotransferase [Auraticoccus monumenti]
MLLVQNSPTSGPGRLLGWFAEAGLSTRVVAAWDGEPLPAGPEGLDALVLLGGGLLPDEDGTAPWLAPERELLQRAVAEEVPVLGICLGAQLLAHCAGGTVTGRSGETERGSCPVRLLAAAVEDPLLAPLAAEGTLRMIQNHRDSITTAPPQAVLLATSEACRVQAFRVGTSAWGVQFHPEADADRLRAWDESALAEEGLDRAALLASAEADRQTNLRQSRLLVGAFSRVVTARADRTTRTGSG